MQLLQFPYRAVFGDRTLAGGPPSDPAALFRPTVGMAQLLERFEGGQLMAYDPAQVRAAQVTPRFSVLARTGARRGHPGHLGCEPAARATGAGAG